MNINSFAVSKLFGHKNIEIVIEDNKLVIVAENGAGKTIVLRLFFLFFSKQWNELIEYDFDEITAVVNQRAYSFAKNQYRQSKIPINLIDKLCDSYPTYKSFFKNDLINYNVDQFLNDEHLLNDIEAQYDVPKSLLLSILRDVESINFDNTKYDWQGSFLYLPTYRRIERSYKNLYGDMSKRLEQHIRQLFPEIDNRIQLEKKSSEISYSETENDLQKGFDTIWSTRDYERWALKKNNFHLELVEFDMLDVEFRISQFLENTDSLTEVPMLKYLEKCNKYLADNKKIVLTKDKRSIKVIIEDKYLPLTILSAGEKHIISLFSYLIFNPENIWLVIDEPEISLSMRWQETLLTDILDFKINGILAATHSPFIVPDIFNYYTRGFNEFRTDDKR